MKTQVTTHNSYNTDRSTEIFAWVLGLVVVGILLYSTSVSGMTPRFEEEAYINDIPFDTELVVLEMMMPEFNFKDEAYINDIPFSTEEIANLINYDKSLSVSFETEEEGYVDDIPFSTELIVENYNYELAVNHNYIMPEENYIDDIPFSTLDITRQMNNNDEFYACSE
jgi:hypothetical protein